MSTEIPDTTAADQPAAPPKVRERHAELSREIEEHRFRYYMAASTISDADFDELMHELQGIEEKYQELRTPDSPTQKVGIPISTLFTAVEHAERMMSLDNAFSPDDLANWAARLDRDGATKAEFLLELKVGRASCRERVYGTV